MAGDAAIVQSQRYVLDCTAVLDDHFFTLEELAEYLIAHVKVHGLKNQTQGQIEFQKDEHAKTLTVVANTKMGKRAVRYYTRRFLKKKDLRDRFHLIATKKDTYTVKAYKASRQE